MTEDDRVDEQDPLLATAKRAIGLVDRHGSIESKQPRVGRSTRGMDESLVELMVENIAAGYVVPPCFLMRPSHLPDSEKELRVLALSKVERDQQLKADLFEWCAINRRVCGQGAVTLRNAIVAIRLADALLNEGDQNDERIYEYKVKIEDHVRNTYRIDVREAPETDLGLWCELKIGECNPVPEWLREGKLSTPGMFVPQRAPKKGATMRLLSGGPRPPDRQIKDHDDD